MCYSNICFVASFPYRPRRESTTIQNKKNWWVICQHSKFFSPSNSSEIAKRSIRKKHKRFKQCDLSHKLRKKELRVLPTGVQPLTFRLVAYLPLLKLQTISEDSFDVEVWGHRIYFSDNCYRKEWEILFSYSLNFMRRYLCVLLLWFILRAVECFTLCALFRAALLDLTS